MLTLLISLCGGLQTILYFLVPLIVNYFMKKRSDNIENVAPITTIRSEIDKLFNESNIFLPFRKTIRTISNFFQNNQNHFHELEFI
jgi:hypothetical protein